MDNVVLEDKVLKLDKSSWTLTKLGDLAKDISKRVDNPEKSKYDRFVGLGNFVSGDIKIKTWETTKNLASSAKAFKKGNILFARRNAYLRRASLVDFDGCCSGDAFVLKENQDKVVPSFLAFLLNSDALWDFANSNAAGTMSKRVKWRDLAEYEFLLPPKDQQAQLAELLWAMDEVIERESGVLEKHNILKEVLRRDYFTIKNNSKTIKIGEVAELTAGGTPSTAKPEYWKDGNIPWLSSGEVHKKRIFETDKLISEIGLKESSAKMMPMHTCLIALAGQGKTKGTVAISEIELSTNQSVAAIIANREMIEPYYLYHNIDSRYLDFRHITGKHNSRTGLNLKILKDFEIVYHNKNERERIIQKFDSLDENIKLMESKISSSKALQKSLINQVF
jgi:type I restriction enzyme S subunit